ncbi:MAG: hypothetical protein F6K19_01725 [Cyanothece sp. SIO1E1]|nr:hypothetical protein [Cyanothece sp. SIO1E1]
MGFQRAIIASLGEATTTPSNPGTGGGTDPGGGGTPPVASNELVGFHITQTHLNYLKDRLQNGPFKSQGDYNTNSPGDWDRFLSDAGKFLTNSYVPWNGETINDRNNYRDKVLAIEMQAAALHFLMNQDQQYLDKIKQSLITEATNNFWVGRNYNDPDIYKRARDRDLYISSAIVRVIKSYRYIRSYLSSSEQEQIDNLMASIGNFYATGIGNDLKTNFPNRESRDYTVTGNAASSPFYTGDTAYFDMNTGQGVHNIPILAKWYNNRRGSQIAPIALIGALLKDHPVHGELADRCILQSKLFIEEWIKYSVYGDFSMGEYERNGDYATPQQGLMYAFYIFNAALTAADAFARLGDYDLYNFSTLDGLWGTEGTGVPKSLYNITIHVCKQAAKQIDWFWPIGGRSQEDNRIDMSNQPFGPHWVFDTTFHLGNLYWQDDFIEQVCLREYAGTDTFPSSSIGTSAVIAGPWYGWNGWFVQHPGGMCGMYAKLMRTPANPFYTGS